MPYDEGTAERLRDVFRSRGIEGVAEKKMFGGIAFMVRGNMACGVARDDLMVRVGPEQHDDALALPHARPMDFTGKPMRGFVFVEPEGYASDSDLAVWVELSMNFVAALPAK